MLMSTYLVQVSSVKRKIEICCDLSDVKGSEINDKLSEGEKVTLQFSIFPVMGGYGLFMQLICGYKNLKKDDLLQI